MNINFSQKELVKIQRLETELLEECIKVFDVLHIEYFLIDGSALGAARHNGFIPWDDDIDIGMTRSNYERFLKEGVALLPSKYHIQSPYNTPNSPYLYTKIRIDGTKFVEYCNRDLNIHQGVYIDIFPFDKVPLSNFSNLVQFQCVRFICSLFCLRQSHDISQPPHTLRTHVKSILRKPIHFFLQIVPSKCLLFLCDKVITCHNKHSDNNKYAWACLFFPKRNTEYVLPEDLYPLKKHKFENLEVNIPHNFDTYLITHYGDWKQFPPEDKRFAHRPFKVELGA